MGGGGNRKRTIVDANAGTVTERMYADSWFVLSIRRIAGEEAGIQVPMERVLDFGRGRRPAGGVELGKLKNRANSTSQCIHITAASSDASTSGETEWAIGNPLEESICIVRLRRPEDDTKRTETAVCLCVSTLFRFVNYK